MPSCRRVTLTGQRALLRPFKKSHVRYHIEYLALTGVVHHKTPYALSLDGAASEARSGGTSARTRFGASSFQIRDLSKDGEIVVTENLAA